MRDWQALVRDGSIERRKSSENEISGLIKRADLYLADSKEKGISLELRYQAAYESGRIWCDIALRAAGYRAKTSGHHESVISALAEIIGPDARKPALILDKARKIRHTLMYGGEFGLITKKNVSELILTVTGVKKLMLDWLRERKSQFT
ncbi:MAG TPA: hypothetical protein ENN67_04745 [Firmicutes bacterium]|nr:hypothetical protein [Bacillota bacterium]